MLVSGDEVLRCFLMMRSSSLILDCLLILLVIPWSQGHSLFTCEPITIHQCEGLSYNMTFFPNKLEHYDQHIAAGAMEPFLPLMKLICSPDVRMFLCSAFVPACTEERQIVPPCRELCEKVLKDCEKLIETFGILWPEELQCDRLEYCNGGQHTSAIASTPRSVTEKTSQMVVKDYGFWCPRPLKNPTGHGSSFLGVGDCLPPCPNMYFRENELNFAKYFIGIVSIICLCSTLFTFLTFLIDVRRFRYPERPIIFYAVCYSMVSLMYIVGFIAGNNIVCNKANEKLGTMETVVIGAQNKGCTILFMLLYFFTMSGTVWWVILTITWFLAAGLKWSCEAIEQKALWYHSFAWGMPGIFTIMLLALNKVEGDNISGVCFVGLYDLNALRYFILTPLCLCVVVGLSLLLAGIISLNHVRQVIQHDERNQEKLKKFMIRIGVFSGLYLVPLVALLGCYIYEQALRTTWETTWVHDYCQDYPIPCPNQVEALTRPDLSLFMMKYLMTLIVGIPAVFWVGSRKTCSEWANFFQSARKRDPITESRRVLQESCEFFLKHNSKVQHQKKHKSGFHKLRVISKSMGTCTTGGASHGTSLPAASPGTLSEAKHFLEINEHHALLPEMPSTLNVSTGERASISLLGQAMSADLTEKGSNEDINSVGPRVQSEGVQRVPDGRLTPSGNFAEESTLQSSYTLVPHYPCPTSSKGCASLVVHALPEFSKVEDPGNDDANA
ncbi:frizzled-6-like isoform X1 [Hypanus sabinus]|uniref:frizzled-6-like isoform X1 n=1 Tax=Hypanus sabinus TaxID=79690 RepID=UPI0028C4DF38|nr:frizzled-6-like isoform X1 [Hypanus sabinus]